MSYTPRHGRLRRQGPLGSILTLLAAGLGVVAVSAASLVGAAAWQVTSSFEPGVAIEASGEAPPPVGPIDRPVNILLVGSDSGGGNAAYGVRGHELNDVTILIHLSPVSSSATVVSFPRDLFVPITGCDSSPGTRKINEALSHGGLACAVSTVEGLTGLQIEYAAKIEFDGVIAMSNAVGGVEVCVAEPIRDSQIGLRLDAGPHTLAGWDALQFLRSRYGVGDGSDTTRVSNQQLFLSALLRKIKAEGTLTNPVTIYGLARAAAENMQLSTSLNSLDAMAAMALAVKDIPLANMAFVSYPAGASVVGGVSGVSPRRADAQVLMEALAADARVVVTGDPGGGAAAGEDVVETPSPNPTATPDATPAEGPAVVELPPTVTGQAASEQTCTIGNNY